MQLPVLLFEFDEQLVAALINQRMAWVFSQFEWREKPGIVESVCNCGIPLSRSKASRLFPFADFDRLTLLADELVKTRPFLPTPRQRRMLADATPDEIQAGLELGARAIQRVNAFRLQSRMARYLSKRDDDNVTPISLGTKDNRGPRS